MKRSILLLATLLLALPLWLGASEIKSGEKVRISEPVGENLYVAGGEVVVEAPIGGDLVAAGGKIVINASIADGGLIAGGEIVFNGDIQNDLRILGGKIVINSNVAGDLVIAAGEVMVGPGSSIDGDLIVMGGKLNLLGAVKGKVILRGGEMILGGPVAGSLSAYGGKLVVNSEVRGQSELSAENISLGPDSRFFSDVRYWNKSGEIAFDGRLADGATARYDESLKMDFSGIDRQDWQQFWFLFSVYRFIAGILLIVLLVLLFHRFFRRNAGALTDNAAANFGYGVLYFIGIPILSFLAFITIIGIPVAFILTAGYGITLALAGALVATVLTYEIDKYTNRQWGRGTVILVAIGISLLLRLLSLIPVAGWLVSALLITVVFGYLYQNIRNDRNRRRQTLSSDDIV
jgi:uncharacterized membrane protein